MTILDSSKLKEFPDDDFKFNENGRKFFKQVEKHCGKRRNCSLRAISPFSPQCFQKTCTNQGLFGKGLRFYLAENIKSLPNNSILVLSKLKAFTDDKISLTQKLSSVFSRID